MFPRQMSEQGEELCVSAVCRGLNTSFLRACSRLEGSSEAVFCGFLFLLLFWIFSYILEAFPPMTTSLGNVSVLRSLLLGWSHSIEKTVKSHLREIPACQGLASPGEGRVVVSVSSMPMLIPLFSFAFNYSLVPPESQAPCHFPCKNEIFCGDEAVA